MNRMQRVIVGLALGWGLTGCANWSWDSLPGMSALKPYSLNFEQGTVIDSEMVGRLKEGMTRAQVAFTLGSPLLQDPFHKERWDYVYYVREDGKLSPPHNLKVYFKDDKLARYETDYQVDKSVASAESEKVSGAASTTPPAVVAPLPANGPALDAGSSANAVGGTGGEMDDGSH